MPAVLEVRNARHSYGDTLALDTVDLRVAGGECVALLGPNGAGKTTLVNMVVGLLAGQAGQIRVNGADPRRASTRRQLGVVQQSLGFPNTLKVGELVTGAAVRAGASRAAAGPVLAELELTELAGRRAGKLSGGQKQRLQLAMALVADPALLVLDEPTVGLDSAARRRFWRTVAGRRARGAGVLITTHVIDEAADIADRVVVLDRGQVLAAEHPEALIARMPDRTLIARTGLPHERLGRLPGVVSVRVQDGRVRLGTREPERLLRALLAEDGTLSDLRVEGVGLEEAVLSLIGEAPRPEDARADSATEREMA